jgi:hypothetical protein
MVDGAQGQTAFDELTPERLDCRRADLRDRSFAVYVIKQTENPSDTGFRAIAVVLFGFDVIKKMNDQTFDENFVGALERLPGIGDEFANDAIIFPAAGSGAVFAKVKSFSSDSDKGSPGGFVQAVFWQLFS